MSEILTRAPCTHLPGNRPASSSSHTLRVSSERPISWADAPRTKPVATTSANPANRRAQALTRLSHRPLLGSLLDSLRKHDDVLVTSSVASMNRSNAGPGSGNPMRHAKSAIWLGALIGLYAVLSGWAAARNEPQSFGDTYRYLENSFLDIQNPGITPSLILQLAGEPNRMLWVQVVISIMAWAALSIAIIMRTRFHPIGWILGVVVLAISLVTPVWSWNSLLASESTAISVGILWLAALIWASDRATGPRLTTLTIAGGLLTVTRPQTAIAVLAITLVYAIWWGRRRSAVLVPILAALSVVGFFTWGVYRLLSLATEPAYRLYYATNNLLDKGSYRDYALSRAPACQPLNDLIVGPQPWPDLFIFRSS